MHSEDGTVVQSPWTDAVAADDVPPQEFSIRLEKDEKTFGGRYYIVFNTTDKQTGLDEYQVMEESLDSFWDFDWGRADAPWVTARSPYVLEDQSLNSTIRVRAIDKAGNEYVATLIPGEELRTTSLLQFVYFALLLLGLLSIVAVIVLTITILRRRAKTRADEVNYKPAGSDNN